MARQRRGIQLYINTALRSTKKMRRARPARVGGRRRSAGEVCSVTTPGRTRTDAANLATPSPRLHQLARQLP